MSYQHKKRLLDKVFLAQLRQSGISLDRTYFKDKKLGKRILEIKNIDPELDPRQVWSEFADIGPINHFKTFDNGEAEVTYFYCNHAQLAIEQLHGKTLKNTRNVIHISESEKM